MWKVTQHKEERGYIGLHVSKIVKEIAIIGWITSAEQYSDRFEHEVKQVKRSNNFSADLMYKVKEINWNKIEIWKLTVTGEEKTKLFTLEYQNNPS